MRRVVVALFLLGLALVTSVAAQTPSRCVAGELALPADARPWVTGPFPDLPKPREGCLSLHVTGREEFGGVIMFRATPRGTPEIADAPHPRLMLEAQAQLASMNVRIDEPKWRKLDVPFSGLEGFGNGTMFGFDGEAIDDHEKSDVVMLFFDGPKYHYDVTLVSPAEADDAAAFKANVDGLRTLLAGLNKVAGR